MSVKSQIVSLLKLVVNSPKGFFDPFRQGVFTHVD
jgi:hypothetical protein